MPRTEIHVSADMSGFGTEVRSADDPERHLVMTPPAELGLSDQLVFQFRWWQWWFDGVVNLCGLEESFNILGDRFDEVGSALAHRVATELGPTVQVVYTPQGGWCKKLGRGRSLIVQE
jgi:hypothetical protein